MSEKYRNNQSSFELNDLIDDAVNSAIARRYQAMNPENSLLDLSDEEIRHVLGGISSSPISVRLSSFPLPVPTIGLIYENPSLPTSKINSSLE
ncbi:hypothetical protein NSTC745_04168 [Nostoc sp. DSM 114161]|jgi:hypothetical protein|uniref:hypothetical protein n=1 Tax=Nostoc sp. DSM 114161 TaxID=3440143 RepID=UPI004045BAE0